MSPRFFTRTAPAAFAVAALLGCSEAPIGPGGAATTQLAPLPAGPVTLDWQEEARTLVSANRLNALAAGRVYAAVSVAQAQAIESADDEPAGSGADPGGGFAPGGRTRFEARRGAVAGASVQVLSWFFPAAATSLEEKLTEQGNAGPGEPHPHFARGAALGRSAGNTMIARLQTDGFTAPWAGTVPTGPGFWIPSALPPGGAMLGGVTAYFMTSGSQFRSPPPPTFGSAAFEADLDEVRTLTEHLTPEQLAFARYWDFPLGTPTPIGFWNGAAAAYVADRELDERAATQVFSLMHAAMFDALIGCWESKYHYWTLRPTHADPDIALAFGLPNFPSYPSGHSCASASAATVLEHFFPDREAELDTWVSDAGLSRILAGIHYRFDVTAGQALGRAAAEWAIARAGP